MEGYEAVIGLEVHAQLLTESKIFCGCSTKFGAEPNTHTCPVCLGMPGVLPVLNKKVVDFALKLALATKCRIADLSIFSRKNYFYPDLPKGYQISQYDRPLAERGYISINVNGHEKRIGIRRIHLEEDAGKLLHDERLPFSYVDFNRTGVPLIEIVSEPDINSPEEAVAYLKKLRDILVYLEICDGNMEEGSFRCDANVSVRRIGETAYGTRTELKNMNSFRFLQKALEYEIKRQINLLKDGKVVIQETRLWDETKQITYSMRGKEEAHDYRYFPDPDLVPIKVTEEWIEEIRRGLPELPDEKRKRFIDQYGLGEYEAGVLTSQKALADYFEACVALEPDPRQVCNWVMVELLKELNLSGGSIEDCPVRPEDLASLIRMIREGKISRKIAQSVFEEMYRTGKPPTRIVEEKGLAVLSDPEEMRRIVNKVLEEFPDEVEAYRGGKEKLFGFFMGQIMRATKGQADPKMAREVLAECLKKGS